ncbi:epidermal growth factor-like protein [Drosophila nasuta]|uniref:epidermal growth factor-like protein n=1 Tax=Drosophila nasuta TaxID=42062 RepID=UPI00295E4085|nr:epidermal growth factor-like protein [Drosophila nasuta]
MAMIVIMIVNKQNKTLSLSIFSLHLICKRSSFVQSKMSFQLLLLLLLSSSFQAHCYYHEYLYWELNDPPPICSEYEMLIVNTHQCVRRCNIVCVRGICFEDGPCPCDNQYQSAFEDGVACAAECVPGCLEAGGYCAGPELCICPKSKHYYYDEVARRCRHRLPRLLDLCRGRCTHGSCSFDGRCICAQGYEMRATLLHGPQCTPICDHDCGPRAYCFAPNLCACRHKDFHFAYNGNCTKDY